MSYKNEWEAPIKVLQCEDEDLKIFIPAEIEQVIDSISSKITNNEFSLVGNIIEETDESIVISPEYYIPEQEVSTASVDIKEDVSGYSVIFHKHPDGIKNFSKTDIDSINNNFMLSILIEGGNFVLASRRIKISEGKFLHILTRNIKVQKPILDVDVSKIKEKRINILDKYNYPDYLNFIERRNNGLY